MNFARASGENNASLAQRSGATASHWAVRWQAGVAREAAELDLERAWPLLLTTHYGEAFSIARRLGGRRQDLRVVARSGEPVLRVLELVEFAALSNALK